MKQQGERSEVLVVGAGPSGLVLACELRRRGLAVRVVDRAAGPTGESRALGLQARTLEILDVLGAVGPVLAQGRVMAATNAYAGGRRIAQLRWGLSDGDTPHPFEVVLGQDRTTAVLLDRLRELGGDVEYGTELIGVHLDSGGGPVEAYLRRGPHTERLDVGWVVGADGAGSAVRRAVDIPFEGDTYAQRFLLADVALDPAPGVDLPDDQGHIFLLRRGPLVLFPYPECGRWRAIDASDQRGDDTGRAAEHFQGLLDQAGVAARVHDVRWSSLFRFHRRIVASVRRGGVLLVGDAAHIHSPATAQGLNTGVQDAFNLGWKLALVARGHAPDALLDTYGDERLPIAHDVLRDSDRMTQLVLLRNPLLRTIRDQLVRLLLAQPAVEHRVARGMSGLDRRYGANISRVPGSVLVEGQRAPSVAPAGPLDSPPALLPFLRDTRLTLLVLPATPDNAPGMARDASALAAAYPELLAVMWVNPADGAAAITDGAADIAPPGAHVLADPDGCILRRYTDGQSAMMVVRPDGHIGASGDAVRCAAYLRSTLTERRGGQDPAALAGFSAKAAPRSLLR